MADTDTLAPPDDTTRVAGATATKPPANMDHVRDMFGLGKTRQTLDEDRAAIEAAKPGPPALTPPPLQPPPTDPLQAFGQPAMWLAALGGLLTRHPLTSAITSAGAVMDSVHKQDSANAQRAFEEWKVHSANAEKLIRYEQEAYKAAIAKYATDARAGEAQIKTLAAAFKNPALAQVLEQEGMTGVTAYVKANGQQAERASVAAQNFTTSAGKKISIAQGLLSDDPKQMADALRAQGDAFVHDAVGKGSSSASRMQADAIRLQLDTIAARMEKAAEDGDQAGVDAAVAEARGIAGAGTASLKPPKVNAEGKPQYFVDSDNTPFQVVAKNGVATVLDMQGKPYTAMTFSRPGTAEAPHVAERRDAQAAETSRHNAEIEKIQTNREMGTDQRAAAELGERTRHDKEMERLRAEPKPAQTPAQIAKQKQVADEATGLVKQIDRLETLIDKANSVGVEVTGGKGWAQRMYERGASFTGVDAGTAANDAESQIAGLRLSAMSFLRRARPNMYTEQQLNDLVRGMGFGETGAITKSGLEQLRQIINDNAEIASGTSFEAPAAAPDAPMHPAPPLPAVNDATKKVFDILTGGQ